jgi:hypothetical protein
MCGNRRQCGVCMKPRPWGTILAILAVASLLPDPGLRGQETTAEEVVTRAIETMGGEERIRRWETIRIQYNLPDHEGSSVTEIRRPNLFRAGRLVFDGERAARLPAPGAEGQGPEMIPAEEWKDFELDIAWTVPAFLDHPTEYLGTDSVLGHLTHMLEVSLPLGATITYYVDAENYMVLKAASDFTLRGTSYHWERLFTNHREVDGILLPWAFTYPGRQGEVLTAAVEKIQVDRGGRRLGPFARPLRVPDGGHLQVGLGRELGAIIN